MLKIGIDLIELMVIMSLLVVLVNEGLIEEVFINFFVFCLFEEIVVSMIKVIESKIIELMIVKLCVVGLIDISDYFIGDEIMIIDNFEDLIYLNFDGILVILLYKEDVIIYWNFNWLILEDVWE